MKEDISWERAMLRRLLAFFILASIKTVGRLLFSFEVEHQGERRVTWSEVRLIAWINHTSLYDVFLISVIPYGTLWRASKDCLTPIAEKTYRRPVVGFIFRNLTMSKTAVSQKRDDTWSQFLGSITQSSMVALFPEGRMKRKSGLDKHGRPLTVRGGIADVLSCMGNGQMLIQYSGGMHHIHAPGQRFPRLFKTVRVRLETVGIQEYKHSLEQADHEAFKTEVIRDLTARRDRTLVKLS